MMKVMAKIDGQGNPRVSVEALGDMTPAQAIDAAKDLLTAAATASSMVKIPESVSGADLKAAAQGGSYFDPKPAA